jgi:hypothetical protein
VSALIRAERAELALGNTLELLEAVRAHRDALLETIGDMTHAHAAELAELGGRLARSSATVAELKRELELDRWQAAS